MTSPQPKPLAEAREGREKLVARLRAALLVVTQYAEHEYNHGGDNDYARLIRGVVRPFTDACDLIEADGKRLAELQANHADMVIRNAVLRQRPDLPADRLPALAHLDALRDALGLAEKALKNIDTGGLRQMGIYTSDNPNASVIDIGKNLRTNLPGLIHQTWLSVEAALADIAALHTGGEGKGEPHPEQIDDPSLPSSPTPAPATGETKFAAYLRRLSDEAFKNRPHGMVKEHAFLTNLADAVEKLPAADAAPPPLAVRVTPQMVEAGAKAIWSLEWPRDPSGWDQVWGPAKERFVEMAKAVLAVSFPIQQDVNE